MNRFRNILFIADHAKGEQAALARMQHVIKRTGASLTILEVLPSMTHGTAVGTALGIGDLQERVREEARERLVRLGKTRGRKPQAPNVVVREGIDFVEVIREANSGGYDLVAKAASSDGGLVASLFGTLDMQLLRKCPCPVLILKPRKTIVHAHVLAAVDLDDGGRYGEVMHEEVLDHAASIAGFEEGSLDVLHVWQLPYEENMRKEEKLRRLNTVDVLLKDMRKRKQGRLQELAARWEALEPRAHLVKGYPQVIIPRFVRDNPIDLVVMGTVGRTGIPGFFMGNTAEKILRSLNCSVLAIKPKKFKSPVR